MRGEQAPVTRLKLSVCRVALGVFPAVATRLRQRGYVAASAGAARSVRYRMPAAKKAVRTTMTPMTAQMAIR